VRLRESLRAARDERRGLRVAALRVIDHWAYYEAIDCIPSNSNSHGVWPNVRA